MTPWTIAHQAPLSIRILQAGIWSGLLFLLQWIFPTQGLNSGLLHCRQILYCLSHQGPDVSVYNYKFSFKDHFDFTNIDIQAVFALHNSEIIKMTKVILIILQSDLNNKWKNNNYSVTLKVFVTTLKIQL